MARKLRLQFEGAIYHVINRGNYRQPIFEISSTKRAFQACLWEAAELHGWRVYAYAIMGNHFHLALETPRANLVSSMHWLLSTFATRFNRFRKENGHLFQGRYRALLVEPGPSLARVVDYIHLNPVRAGLVEAANLASFPWTSLCNFHQKRRPPSLVCSDWLRESSWEDCPKSWVEYTAYLERLASDRSLQSRMGFNSMKRGWAIGTHGWRAALARDRGHPSLNRGYRRNEIVELRSAQWEAALARLRQRLPGANLDPKTCPKGARWKIELAQAIRTETTAPLSWIAVRLSMGSASSLSHYLHLARVSAGKITDFRA